MDNPQMHKSNSLITQHHWPRIRCVGRDTTIQDYVIKRFDRERSGDGRANRNGARREEQGR